MWRLPPTDMMEEAVANCKGQSLYVAPSEGRGGEVRAPELAMTGLLCVAVCGGGE